MKLSCPQDQLARGLAVVSRAVSSRTTLPILSNILLQTDGERLKLSATNLEIGILCWLGAKVEEAGQITVPARLLGEFVNSVPGPTVSMSLNGKNNTLAVSSDRYKADIKGIDAADFPVLPSVTEGTQFTLDAAQLREMVSQVAFAAAADESRPILTGVLFQLDPDGGRLTLAATDGFRLSVREAELDAPLEGQVRVIVPARALAELGRAISDDDDRVHVAITESRHQILFRLKSIELVSQLIEGNFPDYDRIMPAGFGSRAVINTKAFHNAVRIASFFARDAANVVRISLRAGEGASPATVTVSAQAAEVGGNESELEASLEGDGLDIAFNSKYMLDVLSVMGSDQVALELNAATGPGVFRPVSDSQFTHVIMPMSLPRT